MKRDSSRKDSEQKFNIIIPEDLLTTIMSIHDSSDVLTLTQAHKTKIQFMFEEKLIELGVFLAQSIQIDYNIKRLISSPPTLLKIWIDENNTPHSEWDDNYLDIENLYVVYSIDELQEILDFFTHHFDSYKDLYDTDFIFSWLTHIEEE